MDELYPMHLNRGFSPLGPPVQPGAVMQTITISSQKLEEIGLLIRKQSYEQGYADGWQRAHDVLYSSPLTPVVNTVKGVLVDYDTDRLYAKAKDALGHGSEKHGSREGHSILDNQRPHLEDEVHRSPIAKHASRLSIEARHARGDKAYAAHKHARDAERAAAHHHNEMARLAESLGDKDRAARHRGVAAVHEASAGFHDEHRKRAARIRRERISEHRPRKGILSRLLSKAFVEGEHPRNGSGEFTVKGPRTFSSTQEAENAFLSTTKELFGEHDSKQYYTHVLPGEQHFIKVSTVLREDQHNVRLDFGTRGLEYDEMNPKLSSGSVNLIREVRRVIEGYRHAGFNIEVHPADTKRRVVFDRMLQKAGLEKVEDNKSYQVWKSFDVTLPSPRELYHAYIKAVNTKKRRDAWISEKIGIIMRDGIKGRPVTQAQAVAVAHKLWSKKRNRRHLPAEAKAAKFQRPENYDKIEELPNGYVLWAGANDWENGWTWAGIHNKEDVKGDDPTDFVYINHANCPGCKGENNPGNQADRKACQEYAKSKVRKYFPTAKIETKAIPEPKIEWLSMAALQVDPEKLQYKNTDGVEDGLNEQRRQEDMDKPFDPNVVPPIAVWQAPHSDDTREKRMGQVYVVDGHKRYHHAKHKGVPTIRGFFIEAETFEEAKKKGEELNKLMHTKAFVEGEHPRADNGEFIEKHPLLSKHMEKLGKGAKQKLLKSLKDIKTYNSTEELSKSRRGEEGHKKAVESGRYIESYGYYDNDSKTIHIPESAKRSLVIPHELAHAIDDYDVDPFSIGSSKRLSSSSTWVSAWETELKDYNGEGFVGGRDERFENKVIAGTTPSEGFAEFGRMMMTDPKAMKREFPKLYQAWMDLVESN